MKKTITFLSDCIANAFDSEIVARGNVVVEGKERGEGRSCIDQIPETISTCYIATNQTTSPFSFTMYK